MRIKSVRCQKLKSLIRDIHMIEDLKENSDSMVNNISRPSENIISLCIIINE